MYMGMHVPVGLNLTSTYTLQATALQQTLQAMELSSKQQASLSNRSLSELKEKVSRLNAELGKKDQQLTSLKRERERLVRERQAKVSDCSS